MKFNIVISPALHLNNQIDTYKQEKYVVVYNVNHPGTSYTRKHNRQTTQTSGSNVPYRHITTDTIKPLHRIPLPDTNASPQHHRLPHLTTDKLQFIGSLNTSETQEHYIANRTKKSKCAWASDGSDRSDVTYVYIL